MSRKRHGDVFVNDGQYYLFLESKGDERYGTIILSNASWGNFFASPTPFPGRGEVLFNLFDLFKEVVDEA